MTATNTTAITNEALRDTTAASSDLTLAEQDVNRLANELIKNVKDVKNFQFNNWLQSGDNTLLVSLYEKGGALWLTAKGELAYRFSQNGDVHIEPYNKALRALSLFLGRDLIMFGQDANVSKYDLLLINDEEFDPQVNNEFYRDGHLCFKNKFAPSKYRINAVKNSNCPKVFSEFLNHLLNNKEDRVVWCINWLAGFFQNYRKSQCALVLKGAQGSGKGILWSHIINPLFAQTIQIGAQMASSSYWGGFVGDKLFFNFDEIAIDSNKRVEVKNNLKALVTNYSIAAQDKHVNFTKEVKIWGQVLFTSNEAIAIDIEEGDRRYSVFKTGGKLRDAQFLGYKTYDALALAIKEELQDFANYLFGLDVDWDMFDKTLETPEKQAIIDATCDHYAKFASMIVSKDITFFENELEDEKLIISIKESFLKNSIAQSLIQPLFNSCFDLDHSSKRIMANLRSVDSDTFNTSNQYRSNGKVYYRLNKATSNT